jgi:hypothetical protein
MTTQAAQWLRFARLSKTQRATSRRLFGEAAAEEEAVAEARADARKAKKQLEATKAELDTL